MPRCRKWPLRTSQRPALAGERHRQNRRAADAETRGEPELVGVAAEEPLDRSRQQALAGAIHQPKPAIGIEREHGDRDFLHHRPQDRRGLERAEPLLAQRVGQRVHLDQDFAERVVLALPAGADGEVFLTQGREQIRERLERIDDAVAERCRDAPPERRG